MPPVPPLLVERWITTLSSISSVRPAAISSVRSRVRVLPPVSVTEVSSRVVPVPDMEPPVQSKPDVTVSVPVPFSVPAVSANTPPPVIDVLPLVLSVAPLSSARPPDTVKVWPLVSVNSPESRRSAPLPLVDAFTPFSEVPTALP